MAPLQAALFALTIARSAAADASLVQWDTVYGIDVGVRHLATVPSMQIHELQEDEHFSTRSIPSPRRSAPLIVSSASFSAILNDRFVLPLISLDVGLGVGSQPRVFSSLDGQVVEYQPWTASYIALLLPGIGSRWKHRRWLTQVTAVVGVSSLYMSTRFAEGTAVEERRAFSASLVVRATAQVCRRLDPENRACLFAAPALYEFGFINGGAIGLRWEIGP